MNNSGTSSKRKFFYALLSGQIILIFQTRFCLIFDTFRDPYFQYLCLLCRFIKALIQDFSLQLDKGFLLSVHDILSNWEVEEKSSVRIRSDIALVHIPIAMIAAKVCIYL
jgi:hypothetical protein